MRSTRNAPNRRPDGAGNRRGATLVIAVLVMTVIIAFAGFGIDFGRMYSFKSQLKVLTDAAALSGVIDLVNQRPSGTLQANAVALRAGNLVEGGLADMTTADIQPCHWAAGQTAPPCAPRSWGDADVNAIQARARHTAQWSLAGIFGVTARVLTDSSVAMLGGANASRCMLPIATNYANLLSRLGRDPADTAYVLTQDDIDALLASGTPLGFKVGSGTQGTLPGNFGWVALDATQGGVNNPNQYLRNAMNDALTCAGPSVAVGDTLHAIPGNTNSSIVLDGLRSICPAPQGTPNNARSWTCTPEDTYELPIFSRAYGAGNNVRYVVRYVGAFRVTSVNFAGNNDQVFGYLTALSVGGPGAFSPFPGPVMKGALVH